MKRLLPVLVTLWATGQVSLVASEFIPLGPVYWGAAHNGRVVVSDDGQVVVGSYGNGGYDVRGFKWTVAEGRRDLPLGQWWRGVPSDLSADGSIAVGGVWNQNSNPGIDPWSGEAVMWLDDHLSSLGANGHVQAGATAISPEGSVIAGLFDPGTDNAQGFLWTADGDFRYLTAPPNLGSATIQPAALSSHGTTLVGTMAYRAVIWTEESGILALGELPSIEIFSQQALGISDNGRVAVGDQTSNFDADPLDPSDDAAWRWHESEGMTRLLPRTGPLVGFVPERSSAVDTTADGSIVVGWSEFPSFPNLYPGSAMIWNETWGLQNLQRVLIDEYGLASELTGWRLRYASSISADGRHIAGSGWNPQGVEEAYLIHLEHAFVPEPSTSLLAAVGVCAILIRNRYGRFRKCTRRLTACSPPSSRNRPSVS